MSNRKVVDRAGNVVKAAGWFALSGAMLSITIVGKVLGMPNEEAKEGLQGTAATFLQGVGEIKDAFRK